MNSKAPDSFVRTSKSSTGEYITVASPDYPEQRYQFEIYEIEMHDGRLRFAAAEFHYGLWGFYLEGYEGGASEEDED